MKVNKKFARQLTNSLLISKINYNIEIWGNTTNQIRKKLDKILYDAAKIVLGKNSIGRTNQWLLNEMKWMTVEKCYENSTQNTIYKIINGDDENYFKQYLTTNRTPRTYAQNKVRHHDPSMGRTNEMQKTFLYRSINIYNKLPRNITLIKSQRLFKKWVKLYNRNNKIKLKEQTDLIEENNNELEVDDIEEEECYNIDNDIDD